MGSRSSQHIKMSTSQLACTYAALILHDDEMQISADNIKALVTAAGCDVEAYWPPMFAKALEGKDINELLTTVSSGAAGAAGPAAAPVLEQLRQPRRRRRRSHPPLRTRLVVAWAACSTTTEQ